MQNPPPAPTAQGSFAKTPFPHLLVYALDRRLSGSFELSVNGSSMATILVTQGYPAKLKTADAVHYLGDVMVELGLISADVRKASLDRMQGQPPKLHGQVLKELGAVDDAGIIGAVRVQLDRKLDHLFGLPADTLFSYYDRHDALEGYGGPPVPIDPLPALWRGVRQAPAWEHVDSTLRRIGTAGVRICANAQLERFKLARAELAAVDLLRQRPHRIGELANAKIVAPSIAQLLVYLLVITKQVDLVEVSSTRPPAPSSSTVQASPPPPHVPPASAAGPPSSGPSSASYGVSASGVPASGVPSSSVPSSGMPGSNVPSSAPGARPPSVASMSAVSAAQVAPPPPSATGRAFARVQLQAKSVARHPFIVEEPPAARSATDQRAASPLPQPRRPSSGSPAVAANVTNPDIPMVPPPPVIPGMEAATSSDEWTAGGAGHDLDIGSMITQTIESSVPPPPPAGVESPRALHPDDANAAPTLPPTGPARPSTKMTHVATPASPAFPTTPMAQAGAGTGQRAAALSPEQTALKEKILERATQISSQDYFQMLNLDRDATPETVQKAFIALAKVWHPDRLPTELLDVREACSKIFTHLTEAHATLMDPPRREQYMMLLRDGGATPDDQAKIQAILEAATDFQKAEIFLKRNDVVQAYELAKKAHTLDPEQADYLAMVTWLESQRAEWVGRDKTLEKIAILDKCIKTNEHSERAYFWRGMLYKRIDETSKAIKDFKRAAELNPRNLDALREVRLHKIRGGSKPPPPPTTTQRASKPPPPPERERGGLFGKLFKK